MIKWMAHGRDATLPPSDSFERSLFNGLPPVSVINYSEECASDREMRQDFLEKIDKSLRNGQAVVINGWHGDTSKQWSWNEDDLSRLTGGTCAASDPSLNAKAVWQCE